MAQLGARFHGMEEAEGSNPSRSTNLIKNLQRFANLLRATSGPLKIQKWPGDRLTLRVMAQESSKFTKIMLRVLLHVAVCFAEERFEHALLLERLALRVGEGVEVGHIQAGVATGFLRF